MPRMREILNTTTRTNDFFNSSQTPIAKSCFRLISASWKHIFTGCGLFLSITRGVRLTTTTSQNTIKSLSSIFYHHGIPDELISDNGPQYSSQEFKDFAKWYGFCHTTSSPHYPQGNGLAERTVKTVKALFSKSNDHCLALLTYRATPFPWCGLSPSELLMGRKLGTELPQVKSQLVPNWSYLETFKHQNTQFKAEQKAQHNWHRRTLPTLEDKVQVWIKTRLESIMLWKLPIMLLSKLKNQADYYAHKIKLCLRADCFIRVF